MSMRYPGGLIATSPVNAAYPSGVWTQAQAAPYQAQNVWTRDQYWPYTTLLLQGNGTNGAQNNTFLDSSTNNFSVTRNGNTTQGSFTPYEANGYWSNYFDGSGDALSLPASSNLALGTGDFTIEMWLNGPNDGSIVGGSYRRLFSLGTGQTTGALDVYNAAGTMYVSISAGTAISFSSSVILNNAWNHFAITRSGSSLRVFANGSQIASATDSTDLNSASSNASFVGALNASAGNFLGYISNFRVVKGTALYTAAFTPPAAPLTAITNTQLLTCQSNRFLDNSTNNFTITRNGDTSVQAFQPFPGATTWSASVLGGSGYFDGSGDWLDVASNAAFGYGTGDFTIEFWVLPTSATGTQVYLDQRAGSATSAAPTIYTISGTIYYYVSGNNRITGGTVTTNQWSHIALCRSGTSTKMFINGVQTGSTYTDSTTYVTAPVRIGDGNDGAGPYPFPGYISNFRILKGTALYTAAFIPPTAPLTAITNTSLLLNFTNAGISDAAMMNDLETVGNAQVSTSVVKYGTGSMAFDGTGDWLTMPNSKGLYIGSGDFTIEGWLYLNALGSVRAIVSQFNSNGTGPGWTLYTKTTNVLELYGGSGTVTVTGTTAIAATTWTHFAVVRSGSTITIYVNGVAGGSATNSSFSDDTTALGYVGGRADSSGIALNGYIDDLRITKAARYITNFTPPPARMPGQ